MNLKRLKKIIQVKLGNIITDAKAQSVLDKISLHEQGDVGKIIASWENAIDFPEWVKSEITINETFFFRHPEQFQGVLAFLKGKTDVRVLSVGTSSGEEAYSLAMLCEELKINNYKIDAIDLDPRMIIKAKIGKYAPHQIERTPAVFKPLLSKYGEVKNQIEYSKF
jgi:chemotaxis methyl-accepting protein methylase